MDNQSPEMENLNIQMRELMREWVKHPQNNKELKERYTSLHHQYQRLLVAWKRSHNGQP
ncbi:MAG: hypothetical protein HY690_20510 [Chloroflexi bacterium]|nr:hypothetical protein [Chloroflexota bacterium]